MTPSLAHSRDRGSPALDREAEGLFAYQVYGIRVHSATRLGLPGAIGDGDPMVTLCPASEEWFRAALGECPLTDIQPPWYKIANLPDGGIYVRWEEWFHFLISGDGRTVAHALLTSLPAASFEAYLLSQVLSYALVKRGHEPLHVTAVEVDGRAIGFLGFSGFGKSTAAAAFLAGGCRLLTDDLLVVSPTTGIAQPGPRRIKLFPEAARMFLPALQPEAPMNPSATKQIVALPEAVCSPAVPLHCFYALTGPSQESREVTVPQIETLSQRDALMRLLQSTFNSRIRTSERLRRQFLAFAQLVRIAPVKRLLHPRGLERLPEVRAAILADLERR